MSDVKVNKISPSSGTTVTLGDSGDTFTIPSGATINNQGTATNFGATGSASWTTTVKTGDFTAVAGEGYFVNTTSGEIDVALPAGTAGAVVAVKDYLGTFDTNNCILVPNGSDKIGGTALSATLDTEGIAVTLVFIDSTQGWLVTDSGLQTEAPTASYITATGGTITTVCTNFKVHTFTGPGTFTVCSVGNAAGSNTVEYIVVAGGASGGSGYYGAGGGAGGFRFASPSLAPLTYPAKPLAGSNVPVSATGFPIVVGAGGGAKGPAMCLQGGPGSVSSFSTITSAGGGGGGGWGNSSNPITPGLAGGSGGGAGSINSSAGGPGGRVAGAGNTPPVSPSQGEPGGTGGFNVPSGPDGTASSAGGGGAMQAGQDHNPGPGAGGYGGEGGGLPVAFGSNGVPCGSFRYYAGGGGGTGDCGTTNIGGKGGGGQGGRYVPGSMVDPVDGTVNSGGGGGGAVDNSGPASASGSGGSGIVIIRYKFQG